MKIMFRPIGVIHSPFKTKEDIPPSRFQDPRGFDSIQGKLEIFPKFAKGLTDIDGFSHLIILFLFHKSHEKNIFAYPPFDTGKKGVFATRSPDRPSPIGMTVVKLLQRKKNVLKVAGVDMLDGTPILDIKPYTPREIKPEAKFGWLEEVMEKGTPE